MFRKTNCLRMCVALALGGLGSGAALAGGFGIATQSGSGTGNAFAGGAAVADDASVVWSNPAGMTALPQGITVTGALHGVRPSFKFSNAGSTGAFAAPGTGDGGDGGGNWVFIPNGFIAASVTPSLRLGLALNAPFGLTTDYDLGWRGQLTAQQSSIKTVNIQPSIAYKINDMFSLGAGVSYQKIDATLSNFAGAAAGFSKLTADDTAFGYNLGVTLQPSASTRIGAHYRSAIKYDLQGTAVFAGGPVSALASSGVRADLKVPDSASVSILQAVTSNLDLMGDVTWTGWSKIQNLTVIRTTASIGGGVGSTLTNLPFLWKDTWRVGLGANYKVSQNTKLRFGVAHDKTPTQDATRTPRLPDQDRTWLAIGVQYKPTKNGTLEFAYAHEFLKNATINTTGPLPAGNSLIGTFKDKADIISIQYSHSF